MIQVDKSLFVLDGRHRLDVLSLTCGEDAFTLEYTITPFLPGDQRGGEVVYLWIEAADDRLHDYTDSRGRPWPERGWAAHSGHHLRAAGHPHVREGAFGPFRVPARSV
ncbi:hypothetical protein [Lentzea cavernae]|uniref:Uncharacterized protein n=1 Tax=Lentzea cavernae TaxID=2020703 RepID=A0ABQ3M380_9PSEU|nr:hypothetical protein [Lentzea cavernae]GHH32591.1 hypothetical protein GCM10017774_13730 [Lentzea cavernae]